MKRKRKFCLKLSCDAAVKRRKSEESRRKIRSDARSEEQLKSVENFYNRDDISRICPRKKDFKAVKTPGGREFKQKRLLNVKEEYELFKKEEPDLKIGHSKFALLCPRQVMPMSLHDQEVCMCKYHENIKMILDGLKNILPNIPKSSEDLLHSTVCSLDQVKCIDRECNECEITKPLDNLDLLRSIKEKNVISSRCTRANLKKMEKTERAFEEGLEPPREMGEYVVGLCGNEKWTDDQKYFVDAAIAELFDEEVEKLKESRSVRMFGTYIKPWSECCSAKNQAILEAKKLCKSG